MPYIPVNIKLTRSTRYLAPFTAKGEILCPDRIPQGQRSFMLVLIDWDDEQRKTELTFHKPTSGGGDIRFDGPDGPTKKVVDGDAQELFAIYGRAPTAGSAPDVNLVMRDEKNEERARAPMSVGPPATAVQIRAENGTDPAPLFVVPETSARFKAVATPAASGTFRWASVPSSALGIRGDKDKQVVEVVRHRVPGSYGTLCALFTPQNGPAIMAVHSLRPGYPGRIEDRSVAPEFREAATGHRFLPAGTPFTIVDRNGVVVFSGTLDANARFLTTFPLEAEYELKVAGFEGLST